jgi:ribosomal protein S18 acetylase RimI-like enzyme
LISNLGHFNIKRGDDSVKLTEKTSADYDRVYAINDECFQEIEKPSPQEFYKEFTHRDVFVLRFDPMKGIGFGDIVSYAIVNVDLPHAHLWQIATAPAYRGCGFADKLLNEIAREYEGEKFSIALTVKVDNVIAQMLYLKNGYKVESVLYGYYGPEQNGLYMRKGLYGNS